ncbi:hypothetical protein E2F46_08770 [Luteimonas aestuarii]|uniref:Uncharacterized protein n=1 Tax=Luteimonas aestuarii TaxID=453837 RepID=A0A4R5TTM3_9GAMM|nr:hypothetical protein [Luteimonas aestuarii]TDK24366.1 hypothetical protein E2F46_08770 [Luteimonas aestuarii]
MNEPTLYLVQLEPPPEAVSPPDDMVRLAPGLYLVESTASRSRLYHAWKRRHQPRRLLVAALADAPKFKGMQPGALAWLRRRCPG